MGTRWLGLLAPAFALHVVACGVDGTEPTGDGGGRHDGSTDGTTSGHDVVVGPCIDVDMDGISDSLESMVSPAGTPGGGDTDGDGFTDAVEAVSNYPGYGTAGRTMLMCGIAPDDCDMDGTPNFRDHDSDNDGLTDADELTAMTNPCLADTDGDGIDDLTEHVAGSSPTDPHSMPPASALYVTLPYHPPGETGTHPTREFTFATRIHAADIFFLVDNSASMSGLISSLRSSFSTTIVPGIVTALGAGADVRLGVGSFDSMPDGMDGDSGHPGDYTLWIRQKLDANTMLSQTAFNGMRTIDMDTGSFYGGDGPEDSTEAIYETIAGDGTPGHATDAAARRSVHNALDSGGDGWVARMDPVMDCGMTVDSPTPFGWGCFLPGRVPIIVLASDAAWYDGIAAGSPTDPNSHTFPQVVSAMTMTGGFFIGIDVGSGMGGQTWNNAQPLAMQTMTLDGSGNPIVFGPGASGLGTIASQIVSAITTIAGSSRQDITTHTTGVTTGMPGMIAVTTGHTTADFIKAVTPTRGIPDMPTGFDHKDATTFYNVAPSTSVVFTVDFWNDFQMPGSTSELFQATIHVLGRASTEVDHRDVYIIVPATGGGYPG